MTERRSIPNDEFFSHVTDILADGESVTIVVTGRSMSPTFKDGEDRIVISPFDRAELKAGDVVLFDRGDTICVHRIIKRRADSLVIRGDGNGIRAIERVGVDAVMGLVTGGTMRGGTPFSVSDRAWKKNTRRIMRFFPVIASVRRICGIIRHYPLSLLALLVLLYLSFFNPGGKSLPSFQGADKIVHCLMYFSLSLVFWFEWLRGHTLSGRTVSRGFGFCVLLPIFLGGAIELGQEYLVEYRGGEWLDLLSDAVGSALATAAALGVMLPLMKKKRSGNGKNNV